MILRRRSSRTCPSARSRSIRQRSTSGRGIFTPSRGSAPRAPGTFNGDSLIDIVVVGSDGRFRVLLQKPGQVDVIKAIGDAVTKEPREIIHYSHQGSDAPEPAACAFPQRCIRHGMPVVREHWTWQGSEIGQYRKVLYEYQDPRVDLQGRGFLGSARCASATWIGGARRSSRFDHGKAGRHVYRRRGTEDGDARRAHSEGPPPSVPRPCALGSPRSRTRMSEL
jgi:hypothetical protein